MALAGSGTMSIGGSTSGRSINLELGRSATATSSLNESALRTLAGEASGAISLSDFYGASSAFAEFAFSGNNTSAVVTGGGSGTISNAGDSYSTNKRAFPNYTHSILTSGDWADRIELPSFTPSSSGWSFEFWVYPTEWAGKYLLHFGNGSLSINVQGGEFRFYNNFSSGQQNYSATTSNYLNQWNFFQIYYDTSNTKLVINGIERASVSGNISNPSQVVLANKVSSDPFGVVGYFQDIALYNGVNRGQVPIPTSPFDQGTRIRSFSGHRYWKLIAGNKADTYNPGDHFPNAANFSMAESPNFTDRTIIVNYTNENCSDSGTIINDDASVTYDAGSGNTKAFTHLWVYSVFNSSYRYQGYRVQYSDNNSDWTDAWGGVAHNLGFDGLRAESSWPASGSGPGPTPKCGNLQCGGERFIGSTPNDGTQWSSKWAIASGSFDQSIANAFNGELRSDTRARTSGNSVLITMSNISITVTSYVEVFSENAYNSTVTATIGGTTYTSSDRHNARFEIAGTLTQLTVITQGGGGRTYLEGVVVDGYLLKDNANGETGWDYT